MNRNCTIYRGSKRAEMYLYVDEQEDLARVPPELLARFGRLDVVMKLELYPQRRLARADANTVLEAIAQQGFYLQMPPQEGVDVAPPPGLDNYLG
jgi:uncharacterized protein YcgL (UPF0745 family)